MIYSSFRLPLLVLHNPETRVHSFHLLKIDFDATLKAQASLNFDEEIHLVASAEEANFADKLMRLEAELVTQEIYRESQPESPALAVEVTDGVFRSRCQKKRQFFVYLFGQNQLGRNHMRIFSLSLNILVDGGHNPVSFESMKKLKTLEGISHFKSFRFFKPARETGTDAFWAKKLLTAGDETDQAKASVLKGVRPDLIMPGSDEAKTLHFEYLQRKSLRHFYGLQVESDALLVVLGNESFAVIFEDVVAGQFKVPQVTGGLCFDSVFQVLGDIQVENRVLKTAIRTPSRPAPVEVVFGLPVFKETLSLLLLEIIKENFSRHFFWSFFKDVWGFICSQDDRKSEVGGELELLASYFGCLLSKERIRDWLDQESPAGGSLKVPQAVASGSNLEASLSELGASAFGDPSFFSLFKNQVTNFELLQTTRKDSRVKAAKDPGHSQALRETQEAPPASGLPVAKSLWRTKTRNFLCKISLSPIDFQDARISLFNLIHLANEDTRLSRDSQQLHSKLTFFLFCFSNFLNDPSAVAYRNYYSQICPEVTLRFQRSEFLQHLHQLTASDREAPHSDVHPTSLGRKLEPKVFDLIDFLHQIFESRLTLPQISDTISRHPCIFKHYYRIIKVVFLIYNKKLEVGQVSLRTDHSEKAAGRDLSGLRTVPLLRSFHRLSSESHFQAHFSQKVNKEIQLAANKKQNFDRIFMFLLRQKISFGYIDSLVDFVVYFYKSILRLLRKEISKFLIEGSFPKSAYKLLMREDLYANKFLNPVQNLSSVRTLAFSQQRLNQESWDGHKPSEASLHAAVQGNVGEDKPKQMSTMLLHMHDESHSHSEDGLGQPNSPWAPASAPDHPSNAPRPGTLPRRSAETLSQAPLPQPPREDNTQALVSRLEKELNMSGHNYSRNLHFSKSDSPLSDVYRLFNCGEVMVVNKKNYEKIQNYEEYDEERLTLALNQSIHNQVCQRLSSFVGKGALDFGTENMSVTDYISIPPINVTGRIKEKERNFEYMFNPENYTDRSQMNWAEFHNGVAASLSISRKSLTKIDKEGLRTWIEYQKTDFSRYDHAGLVYGLGLQGILDCFTIADIYFNLKGGIDARIIGTILGLAIFKNDNFHYMIEETKQKAFCLLLEVNMNEKSNVQISRIVQAASMIGNGIYNKGTCKKSLLETMLREIEARPVNDNNNNRECHSLAAGFALGLINLGKGSNVSATKDLQLDECLFQLIMDASKGSIFDKNRDGQSHPARGFGNSYSTTRDRYLASNIREPPEGNASLTTPSALVALALIHLKTNNQIVARRLQLPNTIYEIINGNPLHIFIKSLTYHLIMWDSIDSTEDFVISSIPQTVRFLQEQPLAELAQFNLSNRNFDQLDFHNLTIVYFNAAAGTLMAMALKNAGTGDEAVRALLFDYIRRVQALQVITNEFAISFDHKNKIDAYSYFNLLCVLSLALGILMAGRCDEEAKTLIYGLMKKLKGFENEPDSVPLTGVYGFFMAFQMAIGFLFLGNGALTFGNNDFQVACLLMSVYPVFPSDFNDNKFHLQALRHFYILATEEK